MDAVFLYELNWFLNKIRSLTKGSSIVSVLHLGPASACDSTIWPYVNPANLFSPHNHFERIEGLLQQHEAMTASFVSADECSETTQAQFSEELIVYLRQLGEAVMRMSDSCSSSDPAAHTSTSSGPVSPQSAHTNPLTPAV